MGKLLRPKFKNIFFAVVLLSLSTYISLKNFVPGTFLLGWDNLAFEFNFAASWQKVFSAVWQEYQGVGLVGGMAHAADLPRLLYLSFANLFLPLNFLRYSWTFLMIVVGPLGAYFLIRKLTKENTLQVFKKTHDFQSGDELNTRLSFSISGDRGLKSMENVIAAFTGAVFYLLNLSTLQTFFTPFETFISFFGAFPWLLYFALKFLDLPNRKNTILFLVVSFLATPSFYVQTLFVVYAIVITFILMIYITKNPKKNISTSIKTILITFVANAFWLLPVIYFTLTNSSVVTTAKINQIATPETVLMNEATGNFTDLSLMKGFWFEYQDYVVGEYKYLIGDWRGYLKTIPAKEFGIVLFSFSVLGFVFSLRNKKDKYSKAFLLGFVFSSLMLLGSSWPGGFVFSFLTEKIPLFGRSFRSPFTKWSIAFSLFYAVGISLFVDFLIKKKAFGKILASGVVVTTFVSVLILTKPFFEGKLISDSMRVSVPKAYFKLFEFMKNEPKEARIARFPVQTYWGWDFYDWGYRGSGFLWYGLEQPILDRAFDVWSPLNETYYNEISTALYGENGEDFEKVLEKYQVTYFLVDESVINPGGKDELLRFEKTKGYLEKMGAREVFKDGFLSLYKMDTSKGGSLQGGGLVYAPNTYVKTGVNGDKIRRDYVYMNFGTYLDSYETIFPFSNLSRENINNIQVSEESVFTKISLPSENNSESKTLTIPGFESGQKVNISSEICLDQGVAKLKFKPIIEAGNNELVLNEIKLGSFDELPIVAVEGVVFGAEGEGYKKNLSMIVGESFEINIFDKKPFVINIGEILPEDINKCWERDDVEGKIDIKVDGERFKITSTDAAGCISSRLKTISETSLLQVKLPHRSSDGARPHFCVLEEGGEKCLNKEVFYSTRSDASWQEVERSVVLNGNINYWLSVAGRPPDEIGRSWTIEYETPKVKNYPLSEKIEITKDFWDKFRKDLEFEIYGNETIDFFSVPVRVDLSNFSTVSNCDALERGTVEEVQKEGEISLASNDYSTSCIWQFLPDLKLDNSYLMNVFGEGVSGRGMKFYLTNEATERTDLEVLLPTGEYNELFSILDWDKFGYSDIPYSIRAETRSFSGVSENRIENITFYPVNLEFFESIYLGNEPVEIKNNLEVKKVKKVGTYKYNIEITTKNEGEEGLVALSQGYESGWRAFSTFNYQLPIFNFQLNIPKIGREFKHLKVNGWQNGWLVPSRTSDIGLQSSEIDSRELTADSQTILIVYWPQYLQFFGFGILVSTFLILLLPKRVKNLYRI